MGSQLAFKTRIASTQSLAKIFRAQEMIASSHIAKARKIAMDAKPYSDAIATAMMSLVAHAHDVEHPIFAKEKGNNHVAVLAITADRGMAGAYTSNVIRRTEQLLSALDGQGKVPQLYVFGKRGVSYYKYRSRDVERTWQGESERPTVAAARSITDTLLDAYLRPGDEGGVSELYIVFTEFINFVVQKVRVLRMLPIQLVDVEEERGDFSGGMSLDSIGREADEQARKLREEAESGVAVPLYAFEPNPDEVLDAILPRYVMSRIHECLLSSAAAETASRQNAMRTATDNANKLIEDLTRKLNQSRQAAITQELTEIISSADALNKKKD